MPALAPTNVSRLQLLCAMVAASLALSACGSDEDDSDASMDASADGGLDGSGDAAGDADSEDSSGSDADSEGGGDAGTLGDFTLDFTNFDPYVGMKFEVAIEDFDTKSKKGQFAFEPLTSGNDTVFIEGILRPLQYYTIALYADVDGDGACSPPPSDEVWYTQSDLTTESDENGDLTVSVSRPSIWETDTCDYFSGPVDPP